MHINATNVHKYKTNPEDSIHLNIKAGISLWLKISHQKTAPGTSSEILHLGGLGWDSTEPNRHQFPASKCLAVKLPWLLVLNRYLAARESLNKSPPKWKVEESGPLPCLTTSAVSKPNPGLSENLVSLNSNTLATLGVSLIFRHGPN